ncbi:MAG: hypothetical protein AB7I42_25255 [Bradyrhizobium sp.]|uniref:hypothetical protein n=1 Tax=Bradyrhizobium sp. TaxID=376 RepID=UPI003D09FBE1
MTTVWSAQFPLRREQRDFGALASVIHGEEALSGRQYGTGTRREKAEILAFSSGRTEAEVETGHHARAYFNMVACPAVISGSS